MKKIWNWPAVRFLRELVEVYLDKNIPRSAAALTYFLLLTVFPLVICVNAFVGLLHLDSAAIFDALSGLIPQSAAALVGDYIGYVSENQSRGMLIAGLVAVLMSASAALRTVLKAMDEIYERPAQIGLGRMIFSFILSLLFLITMYLSIVVVLTGDWFVHLLETHLPDQLIALIDFPGLAGLWTWMKYLLLFCFMMLLVLALYRAGAPRGGPPRAPVITGAVLASVALVAASVLFSWFIGISSRYSLLYGSLASVIIMMVWLYLCGTILILGSAFNCVWYRHKLALE